MAAIDQSKSQAYKDLSAQIDAAKSKLEALKTIVDSGEVFQSTQVQQMNEDLLKVMTRAAREYWE